MRIIETDRPGEDRRAPIDRRGRRPARRLASAFAPATLEPRALPSVVAAVGDPAAAFVGPQPYQAPPPDAEADAAGSPAAVRPDFPPSVRGEPGGPEEVRPGWATPIPLDRAMAAAPVAQGGGPTAMAAAPIVRGEGRTAMDESNISVDGAMTTEFAFADEATGQISVVVGGRRKFSYQIAPGRAEVRLADLNRDGEPELIVADFADRDVLVFLGRPGGGFGTGPGEFHRFVVGAGPSGITIGNVDGDPAGPPDLVVANKGSDDVSVLLGQGQGAGWTLKPGPTLPRLPAGSAPIRTALVDVGHDGKPDLFVLNSGADDVYVYEGLGGGNFDLANPIILPVGRSPEEMFVGRFDRRPGLDLVTVNSGSNDLTFISSPSSFQPTTMTYPSGGTRPDAAVAVDVMHDGTLDLVVANGGDGRLALLQPAGVGLQLAGVISRDDLPSPTAVAPGLSSAGGFDFYAATAGLDAAAILHFGLGPASAYLAVPLAAVGAINAGDGDLVARLLPFGDSSLDLIAVLWNGAYEPEGWASRSRSPNTTYHLKGEGQADGEPGPLATTAATNPADAGPSPVATPADDPTSWARFVLGLEGALGRPLEVVGAVAARDAGDAPGGRSPDGPTGPDRRPGDLDARAVDDALRALWSDGSPRTPTAPDRADGTTLAPGAAAGLPREAEADAGDDARSEVAPVISSTLLAARLILKASPPRPPGFRRGNPARSMATGPVGGRPTRL